MTNSEGEYLYHNNAKMVKWSPVENGRNSLFFSITGYYDPGGVKVMREHACFIDKNENEG